MSERGLTLFSLVSRQVWPHILAVAYLRPSQLVLLHTDDLQQSKRPAERLRKFFRERSQLLRGHVQLERVPHDDFEGVTCRLDDLADSIHTDEVALNFTGGNKLMATAAFRWAERGDRHAFYLERGNQLTWFEPENGRFNVRSEEVDGRSTNEEDPLALIRCQLWASEVERDGEEITLSQRGKQLGEEAFFNELDSGRAGDLVSSAGTADREAKAGDNLERAAAAVVLKLGVPRVRRSVRLKVNTMQGAKLPHAEIDLLFNWNGRLWLVDCKDRVAEETLVRRLRNALGDRISRDARSLLDLIESELKTSPTKVLKEDLVAIDDVAGLQGRIVCVRKEALPTEAMEYAKRNGIDVVMKNDLVEGFRRQLRGQEPARRSSLARLEDRFPSHD